MILSICTCQIRIKSKSITSVLFKICHEMINYRDLSSVEHSVRLFETLKLFETLRFLEKINLLGCSNNLSLSNNTQVVRETLVLFKRLTSLIYLYNLPIKGESLLRYL